jgi:anthranilate phosphoribosyltransferase
MKELLGIVARGEKLARDLSQKEAAQAMEMLLSGRATQVQSGAFLIALRMKGESAEECLGFTLAARAFFEPPALAPKGSLDVGEPHDGRLKTAPLSWLASLINAARGIPTVVSGNSRVPPKRGIGVAEVLEALEVNPNAASRAGVSTLQELGITYQHLPVWFPRWEAFRPHREEIELRTLFSTVEKLLNPCQADHALVGVFHKPYLGRLAEALRGLGTKRALVVQGPEGGVVPSLRRPTPLAWVERDEIRLDTLDPRRLGLDYKAEPSMPATSQALAKGYLAVLENRPDADPAWRDAACLASALAAALVEGKALDEAFRQSRELLASGAVLDTWRRWKEAVSRALAVSETKSPR